MLKNYLIIAYRNLLKNKVFSLINIFGLATGMAFCMLIYLFIQFEFSFDNFHACKNQIYRIETIDQQNNRSTILPCPVAPTFFEEIPEVENYTRYNGNGMLFLLEGKKELETVQYVDPQFLEIFSFNMVKGDAASALADIKSAVISESIAQKYFGDANPIGQTMYTQHPYSEEKKEFTVSGVIEDTPENSTLQTNILLRIDESRCEADAPWNTSFLNAFILLHPEANIDDVIAKANESYENHYPFEGSPTVSLTNLPNVYFDHEISWFGGMKTSNPVYSYILGGIAVLILGIACINYILLTLTNSVSRSQEVGVRKVLGATQRTLRWQYLIETFLFTGIAMLLAVTLAQLFLPTFNHFTQRQLAFPLLDNQILWLVILGITVIVSMIAGSYPAYWLSRLMPVKILKGHRTYRIKPVLSFVLVTFQFSICVFFITCSLVMGKQLTYISQKDLGFDKDFIIKVRAFNYDNIDGNVLLERFRNALGNDTRIEQITAATSFPGFSGSLSFGWEDKIISANQVNVDHDFFKTLNISISEGRDFSRELTTDSTEAVIINEALARDLELENPVGEIYPQDSSIIIGVIKGLHASSLTQEIPPVVFRVGGHSKYGQLFIKTKGNDIPYVIDKLEKTWDSMVSDPPLSYSFLDEEVAKMYDDYMRWQRIVGIATLFGVLIACLGLFGLNGLMAVNRTKEIGIRKVLGASIRHILVLLNRQTLLLILSAALIGIPVAYYAMQQWLENFAYRISIDWKIGVISLLTGILLVVFTVSYHSIKAALTNPAKSLRYE